MRKESSLKVNNESYLEYLVSMGLPEEGALVREPTSFLKTQNFGVRNYGDVHFFPPSELQDGLIEALALGENSFKYEIPVGSLWVYNSDSEYKPTILKDDVGCGMMVGFVPQFDLDDKVISEISSQLEKNKFGRGNHFFDICEVEPENDAPKYALVIHSDFNQDNVVPTNLEQAYNRQNDAKSLRRDFLETISSKLGLPLTYFNDWSHNTISVKDDKLIYAKGSIDNSGGNGLTAIDPKNGLLYHASSFPHTWNYSPHSVGKLGTDNTWKRHFVRKNKIGYLNPDLLTEECLSDFNSTDHLYDKHAFSYRPISLLKPRAVFIN